MTITCTINETTATDCTCDIPTSCDISTIQSKGEASCCSGSTSCCASGVLKITSLAFATGQTITSIAINNAEQLTSLQSLDLTNTQITEFNTAMSGLTALETLTMPASLTSLNEGSFPDHEICVDLSAVTTPLDAPSPSNDNIKYCPGQHQTNSAYKNNPCTNIKCPTPPSSSCPSSAYSQCSTNSYWKPSPTYVRVTAQSYKKTEALRGVQCSDNPCGLITRWGYDDLSHFLDPDTQLLHVTSLHYDYTGDGKAHYCCGTCLKITADPSYKTDTKGYTYSKEPIYATVIDRKGDPGLDLQQCSLFKQLCGDVYKDDATGKETCSSKDGKTFSGHISAKYEAVDPCFCYGNKGCQDDGSWCKN